MSLEQEKKARQEARARLDRSPYKAGDCSVYSPYSDRRLWIMPEHRQRLGDDQAAMMVLRRDREMMMGLGILASELEDYSVLTAIEGAA